MVDIARRHSPFISLPELLNAILRFSHRPSRVSASTNPKEAQVLDGIDSLVSVLT